MARRRRRRVSLGTLFMLLLTALVVIGCILFFVLLVGDLGTYYKNNSTTKSYFQIKDNEWHTYGLDWRKDSITWYVDGIATAKMDIPEEGITYNVYDVVTKTYSDLTYFFNEPMQIKLSLYCDRFSANSEKPWSYVEDGKTDWENGSSMEIDYVHVYQYE